WQRDRMRNFVRSGFWMSSVALAVVTSFAFSSMLPLVLWCGLLVLLSLRSAWEARLKCSNRFTLLLYGLHSHFQHIPISMGQLQDELSQRLGKRRALIEYKDSA